MKIKLEIGGFRFEGDLLIDSPLLSAVAAMSEAPAELPALPHKPEPPAPVVEPCRVHVQGSRRWGKSEATRRAAAISPVAKPKPEPAEDAGPLRVNTGRSADEETLAALRKHGPCDKNTIAEAVGASPAAVYQRLWKLIGQGRVSQPSKGVYQVIEGQ